MNSPVVLGYFNRMKLDREVEVKLYLQIETFVISAIKNRIFSTGTKLPGSRQLAQLLDVHRKTVLAAYDSLQSQGWIEMKSNSGTYVSSNWMRGTVKEIDVSPKSISLEKNTIQVHSSTILDSPYESHSCRLAFNDGQPDYRLTSLDELTRLYRNSVKRRQIERKLGDHQFQGTDYFKNQLIRYLKYSRGIGLLESQLLIGRSVEMILFVLTKILVQNGDKVLVGNPSYFAANMIFQQLGAHLCTVPVDGEGMNADYIEQNFKKGDIRMLYLSPLNHYPTSVTTSFERRKKLLELADQLDFIIVEEDVDYEFFYEKEFHLPLIKEDSNGRVLTIGSIGRSLAPTFRTGYLIANSAVVYEAHKYLSILDRQGDVIMEQALGELIESGEMTRLSKKATKIYRDRRNKMVIALNDYLGEWVDFKVPTGGLAVWITFKKPISLTKLTQKCRENDLFIPRICLYQNRDITAMRLGFGHLSHSEMIEAVQILQSCAIFINRESANS